MAHPTGYQLTKQWFDFCKSTGENVKPIHTAIYLYCVHLCNQLHWKPVYQLPTSDTMKVLGITNTTTYRTALDEVINFGFIRMVEKSSNQYTANRICLVQKRSGTVLSTVLSTVSKVKRINTKTLVNAPVASELKTALVEIFLKIRSDVPRETLDIEAGSFITKYGEKDLKKDINLINTWAKKITYVKPVNSIDEFNRVAEANRLRYPKIILP